MPTGPFPERFLKCIAKKDRAPLGKSGETIEEATARSSVKLEREMHDQFAAWLRINGIPFIHARTDLRSTIQKGWPDFTLIYRGRTMCVEFKMPGEKMSQEQRDCMNHILSTKTDAWCLTSAQEAIDRTRKFFDI